MFVLGVVISTLTVLGSLSTVRVILNVINAALVFIYILVGSYIIINDKNFDLSSNFEDLLLVTFIGSSILKFSIFIANFLGLKPVKYPKYFAIVSALSFLSNIFQSHVMYQNMYQQ